MRKATARFGSVIEHSYFRRLGPTEQKPVPNRFGTGFCVWQTERNHSDFKRSVILQPNDNGNVRNPNDWILDVYCIQVSEI